MPILGYPLGSAVGGDTAVSFWSVTADEAKAILVSLMPPGQLYDFDSGDISDLFDALGSAAKDFFFDVSDRLHAENIPDQSVERSNDWLDALGLSGSGKTLTQIQALIRSKLREAGAFTIPNLQSIMAPLLGVTNPTTVQILEVDRDDFKTAHEYGFSSPITIAGGGGSFTFVKTVVSGGIITAGIQARLTFTCPALEDITILVTAPDGTQTSWSDIGTGAATADEVYLYAEDFAPGSTEGVWTFKVTNANASSMTWDAGYFFIEGNLGGLGADIFDWAVYPDIALVNSPNYPAVLRSISRVTPAFGQGFLVLQMVPLPDETDAIPNQCTPV
jgi:uncharacterized protein YmfQ (DUF2313 family)